ncbi:MAG: thrombospondin type 3 repeat-containing protein [Thiotrichaceae bacterium]
MGAFGDPDCADCAANALLADTDGDTCSDGEEVTAGSDPLSSASIPTISAPALYYLALAFLFLGLLALPFRMV